MNNLSANLTQILEYLLPGFLAAWVYYGFTSHKKPSEFERVVQALILTFLIQTLLVGEEWILLLFGRYAWALGRWGAEAELMNSLCLALLLGLSFAFCANTDFLHSIARRLRITRETSFPSEWYGTLSKHVTYTVLHLNDERRLYGWVREWPSDAAQGHFAIEQPSWLLDNGEEVVITGVECILIDVKHVKWLEFMTTPSEKENGQEVVKSTAAITGTIKTGSRSKHRKSTRST